MCPAEPAQSALDGLTARERGADALMRAVVLAWRPWAEHPPEMREQALHLYDLAEAMFAAKDVAEVAQQEFALDVLERLSSEALSPAARAWLRQKAAGK